jgi:multidrug efflux pump subunit AcrB
VKGLELLLEQRRLLLTGALLMALVGLALWLTMPRQEDPQMERRWGLIVIPFPGADAEAVERLVVEPVEEELAEVQQIKDVESIARTGVAVINVELRDDVRDFDRSWDDVQTALDAARRELPSGVLEPDLDRDTRDNDAVVLAITGSTDPMVLADAAERVKRRLIALGSVARVNVAGDPGEQITIEYDDATARRLGLDARALAAQLAARNVIIPGGTLRLGDKVATVRPASEFRSLAELRNTPIVLPSGASLPLSAVATVRRGPQEPNVERMRVDGRAAVGLGVVPRQGINMVEFGVRVRAVMDELRTELAPLELEEVAFAPDQVRARIDGLGLSLAQGVLIVALVVIVFMGARLGFVVAVVVPLVAFTAVAIYAIAGGTLQQMSIAALVIALGMLVDNAIVVAEDIQARIDGGTPAAAAARGAVSELFVPLGVATGTTLAAFIPMLLSQGPTAEFTAAIPLVIMLTLALSYAYAVLVTPVLAELLLRPSTRRGGTSWLDRLADHTGRLAVRRSWLVLAGALALVVASGSAAGGIKGQFFPSSDRAQVLVDLTLPEGSHLDAIDREAAALERALAERPDVRQVASFVGRGAPKFYYNVLSKPNSPHLAQLLITTTSPGANDGLIQWIRATSPARSPGVQVIARKLEQGPPVTAPIDVRVQGDDLAALREAADRVIRELREVPGVIDIRDDLTLGAPTVEVEIDDAASARHGATRSDVALALAKHSRGLEVSQYRAGSDPVAIVVRSSAGEDGALDALEGLDVAAPGAPSAPLGQLARVGVQWRPAVIRHRNRARTTSVLAQLEPGVAFTDVMAQLQPRLAAAALPPGVTVNYGGEAEGSGEANAAILKTLPIGVLALLLCLMLEFNSFRKVGIVMTTVPLAATGVIPGLLLGDQPFGFMALLGVIALVGIVVNNAIILLDVVDRQIEAGAPAHLALARAVRLRTRPILLTTVTTIAGLVPLALSETSLWPPLAWSMITGLAASTLLTLLVVPALYRLAFRVVLPRGADPFDDSAPDDPARTPGLTAPAHAASVAAMALAKGTVAP